jgi:hypothetical protein
VKVEPELITSAPNTVWSWDITKLYGPAKWTYYRRFVRKTPEPPKLPGVVGINKPENKEDPAQ